MRQQKQVILSKGFTLLEVIVVLIIMAVLASLILPGIQSTRCKFGRPQCRNRLKQLGLALHQYVTIHNHFPASGHWDVPDADGNGILETGDLLDPVTGWNFTAKTPGIEPKDELEHGMRYSWCVDLLPYLEHRDIYDAWDFSGKSGSHGSYLDNFGSEPDNLSNWRLAQAELTAFICPEDRTTKTNSPNLSYVVNGGFSFHWLLDNDGSRLVGGSGEVSQRVRENRFRMGLMFLEPKIPGSIPIRRHSLDTIKDGVDTTIMLSENINTGYVRRTDPPASWACPHPLRTSFFVNGVAVGVDRTTAAQPYDFSKANVRGEKAPPLVMNGSEGGINGNLSGEVEGQFPYPNSFHTSGINVALANGAVRFISEDIDPAVWARLVTPDGGSLVRPSDGQPQPEERGIGYTQQVLTEDEVW